MKIVIAGGTGFLGRPLAAALVRDGHDVVVLTRGATRAAPPLPAGTRAVTWDPERRARAVGRATSTAPTPSSTSPASRSPADAGPRRRSSGSSTAACAPRAASSPPSAAPPRRPPVFVSGSAVGYYGPRGDEVGDRGRAGRIRFPRAASACSGSAKRCARRATARASSCIRTGTRPREGRRRAAADAAAVPVRRRRTGRLGPPVLAVDSPRRLDRARALGDSRRRRPPARSTRRRRTR